MWRKDILADGKTRFLNVFVAADRTFAGFSQSFPLFEFKSAFFTFSRDYHQALSVFPDCYPDMPEMVNNLFFRDPDFCRYVAQRQGSPFKNRNYFLTERVMLFLRNKRFLRFNFHYRLKSATFYSSAKHRDQRTVCG